MPITERTIKTLFAKSQNRCANPDCAAGLVIGETVLGEICHIRARRKGGARYDPSLSELQNNSAANLILLCPTCHRVVDKDKTGAFSVEWLLAIKAAHEQHGTIELSQKDANFALAILARSKSKLKSAGARTRVETKADRGGIAVSVGGDNHGNINLRTSNSRGPRGYSANSIGADANLSGYIDYLCELYVTYVKKLQPDEHRSRGRIGKNIRDKFRCRKRTRNDLPAERFWEVVSFLYDKLKSTPVGKKHMNRGTKFCSSFEEWRTTTH